MIGKLDRMLWLTTVADRTPTRIVMTSAGFQELRDDLMQSDITHYRHIPIVVDDTQTALTVESVE